MTGQLEIRVQSLGGCLIVRAAGELDVVSASSVRDQLIGYLNLGETALIVDLSRVTMADTTGLSAVLEAGHETSASGGVLRVAGAQSVVRRTLRAIDVARVLVLHDDVSDALEAALGDAQASRPSR
ncbi:MAG TPA: STAS domain-containing protein [Jiangellaceae bacterium]|nr:STAS domain-containing protein [Jiangellaceae bacterium]